VLALTDCELEFVPKARARQPVLRCPLDLSSEKQEEEEGEPFPR